MVILFAHGAGAPSTSTWMLGWKKRLSSIATTTTFDYPYMREGRRAPDPLPKLVAAHREALASALRGKTGPAVLAGKSMGSRVGCHVSLEDPSVKALVCFGYPLASPGKRKAVRDEVLVALIDSNGCASVRQKIRGPFGKPVVEKPSVLASLSGPVANLLVKARDLLLGARVTCEVFYKGSVASPT